MVVANIIAISIMCMLPILKPLLEKLSLCSSR